MSLSDIVTRRITYGLLGSVVMLSFLVGMLLYRVETLEENLSSVWELAFSTNELTRQNSENLLTLLNATKVNTRNIEKLRSGGEILWDITDSLAQEYQGFRDKVERRFPSIKRMK